MKKIFEKLLFGLEIILYAALPIAGLFLMIYLTYNSTFQPIFYVVIHHGGIIVLGGMAIIFFVLFLQAVVAKIHRKDFKPVRVRVVEVKEMEDLVGKEITLYARKSSPGVLYHKEDLSKGALSGDVFCFFILAVASVIFLISFINMWKE